MMRRKVSRQIIKVFRWMIGGTSFRRLKIVRYAHRLVYRLGSSANGSDVKAVYRGLRLYGPARDFSIVHQLFAGYYEESELALFERLAARCRLIIDVGANIGLYSCAGAAKLPPAGRLVAFEPTPENVGYIRRNLAENGFANRVTVVAAAVGETNGEATIYLAKWIGHHSLSAANATGWSGRMVAPLVSLDSYLDERSIGDPDLVKIDVEGYDGFVLRGAMATLRRARPTLLIEYSPIGLKNCGFPPDELLDLIFANYRRVFFVYGSKFGECRRDELARHSTRWDHGVNLFAIERTDHLAILEEWCSSRGPSNVATLSGK